MVQCNETLKRNESEMTKANSTTWLVSGCFILLTIENGLGGVCGYILRVGAEEKNTAVLLIAALVVGYLT